MFAGLWRKLPLADRSSLKCSGSVAAFLLGYPRHSPSVAQVSAANIVLAGPFKPLLRRHFYAYLFMLLAVCATDQAYPCPLLKEFRAFHLKAGIITSDSVVLMVSGAIIKRLAGDAFGEPRVKCEKGIGFLISPYA